MLPQVNYVVNSKGEPISVQMSIKEWEKFIEEYKRLEKYILFKEKLTTIFTEIQQIQKGEKQGTTLTEFLNKL